MTIGHVFSFLSGVVFTVMFGLFLWFKYGFEITRQKEGKASNSKMIEDGIPYRNY